MTNLLASENYEALITLASEVAQREGVELYDIELVGGGSGRVLRVTIDAPGRGVSVEECANVSRGLGLVLDVKDIVPGGRYELEVSSPGIERPLRLPRHFETAIGKSIQFHADEPIQTPSGPRHSIKGKLVGFNNNILQLELVSDQLTDVPLSNVRKAKVVFEMNRNEKKR